MDKVFILLGSDDYVSRQILDVYEDRALAEADIASKKHMLISRQGEPKREIIEKELVKADPICGTCQAEHKPGSFYNHNFVKRPNYVK